MSIATQSASILTAAAIGRHLRAPAVQCFRDHFWEAFAARSSTRRVDSAGLVGKGEAIAPMPRRSPSAPATKAVFENDIRASSLEDEEVRRRRCARDDMFRHLRMSAASRAMRRGDRIMSGRFSLGTAGVENAILPPVRAGLTATRADVAVAMKAREEMRVHFWSSHRAREDARAAGAGRPSPQLSADHGPTVRASAHRDGSTCRQHRGHLPRKLPSTLKEAYVEFGTRIARGVNQGTARPMAITEIDPPFRIVDVNRPWCMLCGYSREEAVGSTVRELLAGPETDEESARNMVKSLLSNEEGAGDGDDTNGEREAVLVNYRSDGMRFRNHVRVGRIWDEDTATHLVGVFGKLTDEDELGVASHKELYANV